MKKITSMLLSLSLASTLSLTGVSNIVSYADNLNGIYADIVYEDDGDIRVDIIFNGMVNLNNMSFDITVGSGYSITSSIILNDPDYTSTMGGMWFSTVINSNTRRVYSVASNSNDINYNGNFCSFYVQKTNNYSSSNATINCDLNYLYIASTNTSITYIEDNPVMLASYEYIVGDANGDGYIDGRDASLIYTKIYNTYLIVNNIKNNYTYWFPNAACAAAPDADQNGIINEDDADMVLTSYSLMMSNNSPLGNVGEIDVFELFD